jgi:beta-glucosidase-like glycosyl hydrolase
LDFPVQLGQDQNFPKTNFDAFHPENNTLNKHVNVQGDHYKLIREIGSAATVLLKNKRNALPLKKPKSLAIIGEETHSSRPSPTRFVG